MYRMDAAETAPLAADRLPPVKSYISCTYAAGCKLFPTVFRRLPDTVSKESRQYSQCVVRLELATTE
jgi:hypothetical protein